MLYCTYGTQRIWRHDAQVRFQPYDPLEAARHPVLEPRSGNGDRERPGIPTLGSRGGTSAFDITFTHPLTTAFWRHTVQRVCVYFNFRGTASGHLSRNGFCCLLNCVTSTTLLKCRSKHYVSTTRRFAHEEQCGVSYVWIYFKHLIDRRIYSSSLNCTPLSVPFSIKQPDCSKKQPGESRRECYFVFLRAHGEQKCQSIRLLLTHSGRSHELIPVPLCTLGGWHPVAHQAVMSIATVIVSKAMIPFEKTHQFLFQSHAVQLVTGNANCLKQGWAIAV